MMNGGEVRSLIGWIEGSRAKGKKNGLTNMRRLMEALSHPEGAFRAIHVAGTNGKGSTCAFFEAALRENGYKTGLYTSPYLTRFQERIRIDGEPIGDQLMLMAGNELRAACDKLAESGIFPTFFEKGTALAFLAFRSANVDIAVVETGLGGRLDPTNVLEPVLCAITAIGYDHTELLGDTLPLIAGEKAGIVKRGVPVVLSDQGDEVIEVFRARCDALSAPLRIVSGIRVEAEDAWGSRFAYGDVTVRIALPGRHQIENAALAVAGLDVLRMSGLGLSKTAALRGFELAAWPGRLEWLNDHVLVDGAHNEQGAMSLRLYLDAHFPDRRKVLLTGIMRDKAYEACAEALAHAFDRVIATRVDWPKALDANALREAYARLGVHAEAVEGVKDALEYALSTLANDELLVVSGSLYLVGEVRALFAEDYGSRE